MKMTKTTIDVLKNFATINQGLVFLPGTIQKTINVARSIFVQAQIEDEIPTSFAIYDLNEFLGTLSLMKEPDITFQKDKLLFTESKNEIESETEFYHSSPNVVVSPDPNKSIKLQSEEAHFTLTKDLLDRIYKHAAVMKLKDIQISKKGIQIFNKNNVGNRFSIKCPIDCVSDYNPSTMKIENLKFMPFDYQVTISEKGIAKFVSQQPTFNIEYFITLDFE